MKKFVSIILAIATVFSIAVPAFAKEDIIEEYNEPAAVYENYTDTVEQPEAVEDTDEVTPDNIDGEAVTPDGAETDAIDNGTNAADTESDFLFDRDPVAILYLCASGIHSHYAFGHTWICIKNISKDNITVSGKVIAPNEMASFGLHHDGGMHCNREIERYSGETVEAKQKKLSRAELLIAAKEISNSRWGWYEYFAHNCTNFATTVWNKVTGAHLFAFCFPFVVQLQMAFSGTESLSMNSY